MTNLSCAHQIVECRDHFFDRRYRVPRMQPVKIDKIRLQSTKRTFEGAIDILSAVAARVGIARLGVEGELRRQHDPVA